MWWRLYQQQRVWPQNKNCSRNVIKSIRQIIYVSDEFWMWVHQNMEWVKSYKDFIQSGGKLLFPCCYRRCSVEFIKQWMGVIKYEGESIENMEWVESYENFIQSKNNCSYLAVTNNVRLNRQNHEWEWWIMKISASKICNESNHTKISFNRIKTADLTLLLRTIFDWTNEIMNDKYALWRWVHQKYGMSRIM